MPISEYNLFSAFATEPGPIRVNEYTLPISERYNIR